MESESVSKIKVYAQHLETLADRHNGALTAEIVVADAKRVRSPIHECFTWDDREAAKEFRLEQARRLIRTVYVIVRDVEPENTVRIRRFEHVSGQYRKTDDILQNGAWKEELLQRMARDIAGLRQRYRVYSEMGAEFADADRALQAAEETVRRKAS